MKKTFWIGLLCAIAMLGACLAGCGHEHTYSDKWSSDASNHWHAATCEHKDEVKDKAGHTFGEDGKCTVCGYETEPPCEHSLFKTAAKAETCTKDGNIEYWFCSDCGKYFTDADGKNEIEQEKVIIPKTGHSYEENLSAIDRTHHGYKPTCVDTEEYKDKAEHRFGSDNICQDCGYELRDDTTAYAGRYFSFYEGEEGWEVNRDFYVEIGINSDGVMYNRYIDYDETTGEAEQCTDKFDLSVEIKNGEISITYTNGKGETVVKKGFIGDNKKLGNGTLLLDWGGSGYYFCQDNCTPWVESGDFVLEYFDSDAVSLGEDWTSSDGYSILAYNGNATDLVIPDALNGIPVVRIKGVQVFAGLPIKSLKLGDNLISIGGEGTFYNCTTLESIHVGAKLTSFDAGMFEGVSKRKTITVSENNPELIVKDNCLINTKTKTLILGTVNSVIPTDGSVKTIASCAFYTVDIAGEFVVPEGVEYILAQAFEGCRKLTKISLPVTLEAIGAYSFADLSLVEIAYAGTREAWEKVIEASAAEGYIYPDFGLNWFDRVQPTVTFGNAEGGPTERVSLTVKKSSHTSDMTYTIRESLQSSYKIGESVTFVFAVYDTESKKDVKIIAFVVNGEDKQAELTTSTFVDDISSYDGATLYTYTFTINAATEIQIYEEGDEYNAEGATVTLDYDQKYLTVDFIEGSAECKKGDTIKLGLKLTEGYTVGKVMLNGEDVTATLSNGDDVYDKYLTFTAAASNTVTVTLKDAQGEDVVTTYKVTIINEPAEGGSLWNFTDDLNAATMGQKITLNINVNDDYALESLTVNGEDVTKQVYAGKYTLTVTGNMEVKATFKSTAIELPVKVTFKYDDTILTEVTIVNYDPETRTVTVGIYSDSYYTVTKITVNGTVLDLDTCLEEDYSYEYDYYITFQLPEGEGLEEVTVEIEVVEDEDSGEDW